jgi:hypothetical protein
MVDDVVDAPEVSEWAQGIENADLKAAVGKFESQEAMLEAVGYKAPEPVEPQEFNWRDAITDPELKEFAERSTDLNHFVGRTKELRSRLSRSIVVPGKDASDEDVIAYQKALGIPATAEDYEFPNVPESDLTEEVKASRASWAAKFHELGISKPAALALAEARNAEEQQIAEAAVAADKAFAAKQEETLQAEWKGDDYKLNTELANRAFEDMANRAGLSVDELRHIETKDGRFLMDRADIVRMFATVGREMAEGSLGPTMTDAQLETNAEQIRALQTQIREAQDKGDSKLANSLYQKELALQEKAGNQPVVGAQGRVL